MSTDKNVEQILEQFEKNLNCENYFLSYSGILQRRNYWKSLISFQWFLSTMNITSF